MSESEDSVGNCIICKKPISDRSFRNGPLSISIAEITTAKERGMVLRIFRKHGYLKKGDYVKIIDEPYTYSDGHQGKMFKGIAHAACADKRD
jgi:hypothetical protein